MFVGEQRGKNIDFPLLKVRQVSIIIEPGQPFECSVQFIYIYIYMFVILVSMEWEGHVFVAVSLWPKAYFGRRLSAAEDGTLPFSRG